MRVAVFQDCAFRAMPTYGAEDALAALRATGHVATAVDAVALSGFGRSSADVLVLPYLDGTFGGAALAGLVAFHAEGGGLVVLGDLPHRGPWYPYRNMESWRLHMTRGSGTFRIDGLSPAGQRILGWDCLPDAGFFAGRTLSALRTTAFPPDVAHTLLHSDVRDFAWQATPVVAVERFGEPFLGARFAMVGFNGGEPRENVAGVFSLPWDFDPGLLTREWGGMDALLCRLVDWCTPRNLAVRLDLSPLHHEDEPVRAMAHVRNSGIAPVQLALRLGKSDVTVDAPPGSSRFPLDLPPRTFGIHRPALAVLQEGAEVACHITTEYVLPADAAPQAGYGFSTYWAFPGARPVAEFAQFCREMRARGCQYVRVNLPWEDVEPEPGHYDWTLPDALLDIARETGLLVRFWMFPTTRGSGLSDAGVPAWTLREPSLTFDGRPGFFPTLWSEFYRTHYFNMVRTLARRYRDAPDLDRLIIDFGNSDFPYGYFYYGGDNTLFDYSPQEQAAFRRYVRESSRDSLPEAAALLGGVPLARWEDVAVPRPTDPAAWRVYLDFRHWSIQQGIGEVDAILRAEAPAKVPPDPPGHGAGSISDLSSFGLEAMKRHWGETGAAGSPHGHLHNSGPSWGGEPWQVGARYAEYDDALFQSLRLNADYFSLPGVDLGVYGDDVARIGFIRRTVMGAVRDTPQVAIYDRLEWNAWQSLAQVGSRLDVEVDLLQPAHRHDLSGYRLVALPPEPWAGAGTVTGGGGGGLVPQDEAWWQGLHRAVERGLEVLVFPAMADAQGLPFRTVFGLSGPLFGDRHARTMRWPETFRGGEAQGACRTVTADGTVAVRDTEGHAVLVRQPHGRGALWLAGFDTQPDSLDGALCHERDATHGGHTLSRLLHHLGIVPTSVDSGGCNVWKSVVRRGQREFLLVFSHCATTLAPVFRVCSQKNLSSAWDLATGERVPIQPDRPGWWRFTIPVHCRKGRYLALEPERTGPP